MRKVIFYIVLITFVINCKSENKDKNDRIIMKTDITKNNMYTIYIHSQCVFDLYINDIPAVINEPGNSSSSYDVNDYILENGRYRVKAIFYTNPSENLLINNTKLIFYSSLKNGGEKLGKLKELQKLTVPDLKSNQPTKIVQEWEIEVTDLPYKLEGWKNSRVFKKGDSAQVKEKAVAFYENLRILLNKGNGEEYIKYFKNADAEMIKYDFIEKESLAEANKKLIKGINYSAKNNMLPLEDFTTKIYAQGRLICLERIGNIKVMTLDKKFQTPGELSDGVNKPKHLDTRGWSPLIVSAPSYINNFKIYLHMPQGSDEFEIIR